jgi:hypothetical protein
LGNIVGGLFGVGFCVSVGKNRLIHLQITVRPEPVEG